MPKNMKQRDIVVTPKPDPPATSWWLGVRTREDFTQRHAQQLPRMHGSKFGTRAMLITPPQTGG